MRRTRADTETDTRRLFRPGTLELMDITPSTTVTSSAGDSEAGRLPFLSGRAEVTCGEQRFNVFCSMCHGLTGDGDGRVVKRGFTAPPNFHTDLARSYKLRGEKVPLTDVPPGYVFDVITRGYGAMPEHAAQSCSSSGRAWRTPST